MNDRTLALVLVEMESFVVWSASWSSGMGVQVAADLGVISPVSDPTVFGVRDLPALLVYRDALYRLCGLATQGGFEHLAPAFYEAYEEVCMHYEQVCIHRASHMGDASHA